VRRTNPCHWLLLIHQLPAKPDYLRVRIRRRLGQIGAVALKNSVYVLPDSADNRSSLSELAREVLKQGGDALVCEARMIEGLTDGAVEDRLRELCAGEYATIARLAKRLASELRKARGADDAKRRKIGRVLERLRARFDVTVLRDLFEAPGRETAGGLLSLLEDLVEGVEQTKNPEVDVAEPPRAATWVTRTGVMVDRIASAWLIRRFIDPQARFKFVNGRGYRPRPGEIRFDMAGAEFTHHNGRCTFEVLTERFHLRDSALKPIAEIVHDLDLEDERYKRPEAAGVDRVIVGLAIARQPDETRLVQGGSMFENLYESFRRRTR
jgi:hypothetical protein